MEGLSERQYAARVGLSRGAFQKAKATGGWCCTLMAASTRWPAMPCARGNRPVEDPQAPQPKLKPVPEAAVSAVGETLREQGLAAPPSAAAPRSCRPRRPTRC